MVSFQAAWSRWARLTFCVLVALLLCSGFAALEFTPTSPARGDDLPSPVPTENAAAPLKRPAPAGAANLPVAEPTQLPAITDDASSAPLGSVTPGVLTRLESFAELPESSPDPGWVDICGVVLRTNAAVVG